MEQPLSSAAVSNRNKLRLVWITALAGSFVLCIVAIFRGGYVGPDYFTHLMRFVEWPKIFDFSATNPPGYFLLGRGCLKIFGETNRFLYVVPAIQAGFNTLALGWFALFTERRFRSPIIHTSLVLFLAFLPARLIHSTVLGADCTTIPAFMFILFSLDKLLSVDGLTIRNSLYLAASLTVAVSLKYTFMALLPAIFVILVVLAARRSWGITRFITVCFISLFAASILSVSSIWMSKQVHGYNTEKHWIQDGTGNDMNFRDIFSVKWADRELFRAPQCFKQTIAEAHVHSYLGLAHYGIFTDPMNLFQDLNVPQVFGGLMGPDQKERSPSKTPLMIASMSVGVIWTVCAVIGTVFALFQAAKNLWSGRLEREDITIILGTAFFLIIFLSLPFVFSAALHGYWTPRLILPSLVSFSLAGFLFIERKIAKGSRPIAFIVFGLVAIQSTIEILMLT